MSRATLRWFAAFVHICRFIAGATKSVQSLASVSVDNRLSAWPFAILARKSAEAGAMTIALGAARQIDMAHAIKLRRRPTNRSIPGCRRALASSSGV